MAAFFQLWNNETSNLIGEYETEAEAAIEVRRRYWSSERALDALVLLQYENPATPRVIALHDDLLSWLANLRTIA